MNSVFIKVPVSDRLPEKTGSYIVVKYRDYICKSLFVKEENSFCTHYPDADIGQKEFVPTNTVYAWFEEIQLPTEEEIVKESDKGWVRSHFKAGANFILNHIKKGG